MAKFRIVKKTEKEFLDNGKEVSREVFSIQRKRLCWWIPITVPSETHHCVWDIVTFDELDVALAHISKNYGCKAVMVQDWIVV